MVEELFRRIGNPNNFRREILESSKLVINNLKTQQKIKEIRQEKTELIRELKIYLKEINLLLDKMRDAFPAELIANHLEEEKKEKQKRKESKKKDKKQPKKKAAEPSELTKLENKLADIENKLKTLS